MQDAGITHVKTHLNEVMLYSVKLHTNIKKHGAQEKAELYIKLIQDVRSKRGLEGKKFLLSFAL